MTSGASWTLHSGGVDWITVTATAPHVRAKLAKVGRRLLDAEEDGDSVRSETSFRGYVGHRCGGVLVGERDDSYYCHVSGGSASSLWLTLLDLPVRVKRLDLQATAVCPSPKWDEVSHQFRKVHAHERKVGAPRWYSRITTPPHGATLYLGAPTSDRRLRLYNKWATDPDDYPPGAWRYEVQARNDLAGALAASLVDRDGSTLACVDTVHKCFSARGVRPRFRTSGGGVLGSVPRSRSDAQRRIKWLSDSVEPAVRWLIDRGYEQHVMAVLGLGRHGTGGEVVG